MRKFTTTIAMMIAMVLSLFAQVPQTMSYQAVVRNAENAIVASQSVSIELSILQGSDEGTAVYTETHNATTNANGLITLEMGAGESSDDFSAIDWSAGPYFVKTVAEINGKQVSGVSPMLVVPYAKYAETAGNVPDMSEYAKKSDIPEDVDLSNYATKSELPSLEGYAKTEDIPSLDGYAKTEDLPNMSEYTKTADLPTVDLSGYAKTSEIADMATKTYVDAAVAAVEVPTTVAELTDAGDYAKTSDVSSAIATATTDMATKTYVDAAVAAVEVPTTVAELTDAGDYAKMSEVSSAIATATTDMATKTYVDGKVAAVEVPTKVSELTDAGDYAKTSEVSSAIATATTDMATKTYVDAAVAAVEVPTTVAELTDAGDYANVQADWSETDATKDSYIKNKPTLATVATSGSYEDLSNKPTIPDVTGFATKTELEDYAKTSEVSSAITTATTDMATKTYVDGKVAAVEVPTTVAELTDAGDYAKTSEVSSAIATATTDMATKTYVDDKVAAVEVPTTVAELTDAADYANVQSDWAETDDTKDSYIKNKPTLATVATSGSYEDLSNKPTIPDVTGFAVKDTLQYYYKKSDVDALLAELTAKIKQLDEQLNPPMIKDGAIQAAFSISADDQVYFSQGNLQYQASTSTWRFAENQYDIIGGNNSNISSTYSGWIDLFGWGTSGWNSGANAYQPYSTNTNNEDYYPGGSASNNLTGSYANADWGVYNKISNGGNTAGQWRTLTNEEWEYLLNTRTDASALKGLATVDGVTGMILLPDNWTTPSDITFTIDMSGYDSNTYTTSEWAKMEANGAVFLPAAGIRDNAKVGSLDVGLYWSSSAFDNTYARYLRIHTDDETSMERSRRCGGRSVRLVKNVE